MTTSHPLRTALLLAACTLGGAVAAPGAAAQVETGGATPAAEAQASAPAETAPARPARSRGNRLTREEVLAATQSNLLDVIRARRPLWLRPRGAGNTRGASEAVRVYVDGAPASDAGVLRTVDRSRVLRVEFLNGAEASGRFGVDHVNGAILVTTGLPD